MGKIMSEAKRLFSATNAIGYIFGLLGLSIIAVTQFLTELLPLLFAPLVCATLGAILYATQSSKKQVFELQQTPIPTSQK